MNQSKQDRLFPFENPLDRLLGREFFRGIPRAPGVYRMWGENRSLLYVGKAKDLRARISSYRLTNPERASRKTIRMLYLVREISWELCASEKDALLLENLILRTEQPPFNVLNTSPGSYYFIGLKRSGERLQFTLTTNPQEREYDLHGAYKGRGMTRLGYGALLRLLWLTQARQERFAYPGLLCRRTPPYRYELKFDSGAHSSEIRSWECSIRRFLRGTSKTFLHQLTDTLLENETLPRFIYHSIQDDIETLAEFYELCPLRNKELRRIRRQMSEPGSLTSRSSEEARSPVPVPAPRPPSPCRKKDHLLLQSELDDLLVIWRLQRNSHSSRRGIAIASSLEKED